MNQIYTALINDQKAQPGVAIQGQVVAISSGGNYVTLSGQLLEPGKPPRKAQCLYIVRRETIVPV